MSARKVMAGALLPAGTCSESFIVTFPLSRRTRHSAPMPRVCQAAMELVYFDCHETFHAKSVTVF